MVLTAGQTSDYTGARELLDGLPKARHMIADRGYDGNCFARLKDWRRVATRYDRCSEVFFSACALAAVVRFWLQVLILESEMGK